MNAMDLDPAPAVAGEVEPQWHVQLGFAFRQNTCNNFRMNGDGLAN